MADNREHLLNNKDQGEKFTSRNTAKWNMTLGKEPGMFHKIATMEYEMMKTTL